MRENLLILLCTVWKRRDAAYLQVNARKTKEMHIDVWHNPPAPQNSSSEGEVIKPTSVGLKSNKTNQKSSDCEGLFLLFLLAVKHWFWSSHSDPAVYEAASTLLFPFSWSLFLYSHWNPQSVSSSLQSQLTFSFCLTRMHCHLSLLLCLVCQRGNKNSLVKSY